MSRKKIAAATMTLAALGLGFAGYMQVTRANNDTEERDFQAGGSNGRAYLANHQSGHGSAVFKWAQPEETFLPHSGSAEPFIGQCFYESKEEEHALIGSGKPKNGGSGDVPHVTGGGGGSFASNGNSGGSRGGADNFSGWSSSFGNSGFGSGSSGNRHRNDNSNNNPPTGSPQGSGGHDDTPPTHTENDNTQGDHSTPPGPGSNEPKAGDPPPSNHGDQTPHDSTPGTDDPKHETTPNDEGGAPGDNEGSGPETNPTPPGPDGPHGDYPPHHEPPPPETHSVPEPGTLGLLAFGMGAALLRRRRRS